MPRQHPRSRIGTFMIEPMPVSIRHAVPRATGARTATAGPCGPAVGRHRRGVAREDYWGPAPPVCGPDARDIQFNSSCDGALVGAADALATSASEVPAITSAATRVFVVLANMVGLRFRCIGWGDPAVCDWQHGASRRIRLCTSSPCAKIVASLLPTNFRK